MNCLIENEYIKKNFLSIFVFTNELPNWKRIHKGKKNENKKKREKNFSIHKWIA